MNIDVHKARFKIFPYKGSFAIVVKYGDRKFLAQDGSLSYLKPKFIQIVKQRECLRPFLERALCLNHVSFEEVITSEVERKLAHA